MEEFHFVAQFRSTVTKVPQKVNRFKKTPLHFAKFQLFLVTSVNHLLVANEIKLEGFTVSRFNDRHDEAVNQLKQWIDQGKLVYQETVTEGFGNMVTAFIDMLNGGNTGKAVVKV